MRDDAARTADEIRQSLTDALMRGFERGKGLAQNLRDTVVNMFKTLVLRPTIEPYINQAAGWLQGALGGGAGGGGFGSLIGGIGSLFNSSWLSAFGSGMGLSGTQAAAASSAYAGAGMSGTGSAISLGSSAAAFGPYAALIALAMGAASNAYAQGFNQRNLPYTQAWLATGGIAPPSLKFDTNLLTKLGVNEKLANVITGASLWSKAFGRSDPQVQGQGVTGTASATGFAGFNFADWTQKGGWFRSNKSGTDFSPISAQLDAMVDTSIKAMYSATSDYAKVLGLPVEAVTGYAASFKVAWGKTEEENQKALQAAVASLGEQLAARYATQLAPLQKAGETLAATLQRLSTLQTFSSTLNSLGGVFSAIGKASVGAREKLIELAGGMESLAQQAQGFVQNYYSRDEIAGLKAAEVQNALASAGLSGQGLSTRDDFRALVESIDPRINQQQLATLLSLQGSFATVADYLAETGLTLGQAAAQVPATETLVSPLLSGVGQQVQLAQQGVDAQYETRDATLRVVDAVAALTSTIRELGGSAGGWMPGYRQPEVTLAN
jgi:hypothetical protein